MKSHCRAGWTIGSCGLMLAGLIGCAQNASAPASGSDSQAAFTELVHPRKIRIEQYLTKPVSFAGTGDPDGLELVLAATDALDDQVKSTGKYQFELHEHRPASGDPVGDRIAYWEIPVNSLESLRMYWDRLARFHVFPLRLEGGVLKPGRYVVTGQLVTPSGVRLFDEYEFELPPGPVVPAASRP